ncbi:MAG TPA: VCBS repeat-containing protein, partial [Cyclobacteriaceae bacterium]|nr:VCBS repeat-containing protein [Cyclobacteriaceae bacterium]
MISLQMTSPVRIVILYLMTASFSFVGCKRKEPPLFTKLSPNHSGVTFENTIRESPEINILSYEYTYNGGGVTAGDFNNDGLCDLYFTGNTVKNRLYLNKGDLQFKDVTDRAGVAGRSRWKTGVTAADVNGDGWLDLYVCYSGPDINQSLSNELYINNGGEEGAEPTFTEQAKLYGLDAPDTYSTQASFFDYDRDGDLDMFLINHGNHFYSPFVNTNKLRNTRHPNFGNRLYRNNLISGKGDETKSAPMFTEVSQEAGIHGGGLNFSLGVSVSDVNDDGWPDIYVTNDYEEQDFFYLNKKDGSFQECTKGAFGHLSRNGMGTDFADYNNDGKTDLIEVDMWPEDNYRQKLLKGPDDYHRYHLMVDSGFHLQQMRNTLQLNTGNDANGVPIFSEIGQMAGVAATDWSWAPLLLDVDNDGLKDLFVTNGYLRDFTSMDFLKYTVEDAKRESAMKGEALQLYKLIGKMSSTKTSDYVFRNNGDLTFSDFSREWGIYEPNLSFGASYADLDNDGDLEIISNNTNELATVWKNNSTEN